MKRIALLLGFLALAGAASAQSLSGNAVPPTDPKKAIANRARDAQRPADPAALPGAVNDRGEPAPATEIANAMSPNEALFDAVNRGDVPGARAALARGADIDGRNPMGLTAVELAVDLGRSDMMFLLLSLRAAQPGARAAMVASTAHPAAPAALRKAPVAPIATARSVAVAPSPVHYSPDPGTPAPAAGFLGFAGRAP